MERTKIDKIPIVILLTLLVLVPLARFKLFFDSYLIKFYLVHIGLIFLVVFSIFRQFKTYIDPFIKILLGAYLLINLISWIIIPEPHRIICLFSFFELCNYILLCFFAMLFLKKYSKITALVWISTGLLVSIKALLQYYRNERVISTLGNENFLASYLVITIIICLGYFLLFLKKNNILLKKSLISGFCFGILLIFITVLYYTHSRGAWMGLFYGICSFFILYLLPKRKRLIAGILVLLITFAILSIPYITNFISIQLKGDVRPAIWESSLYMISMKPILGWGKGAFFIFYPQFRITDYWLTKSPTDLTNHAHNEFLQITAETGIVGLLIFILLIAQILRIGIKKLDLYKNTSEKVLLISFISSTIALLTHNLVCNNLQINSSAAMLWLLCGLVAGFDLEAKCEIKRKSFTLTKIIAVFVFIILILWQFSVKPITAQILFKKGWNHRIEENWDEAIDCYERALKWWPYNVEMYYRAGYVYARSNRIEEAIKKYKKVLTLAPDYGSIHKNIGIAYMIKGEYQLAAKHLGKARQINPYDTTTLYNLQTLREEYVN